MTSVPGTPFKSAVEIYEAAWTIAQRLGLARLEILANDGRHIYTFEDVGLYWRLAEAAPQDGRWSALAVNLAFLDFHRRLPGAPRRGLVGGRSS